MAYKKIISVFTAVLLAGTLIAQHIPDKPYPPRLINDYAGILSREEADQLEQKLIAFNDSTSIQIAVVIVKSLNGYDKADFAQRIGEKWGIGQKGKNNGVIILIKPKYENEKGEAFIATGYGMEGILPDALCYRIVNNEMIPAFRQGDYHKGISRAIDAIISISKGEYKADNPTEENEITAFIIILILFVLSFIFIYNFMKGKRRTIGRSTPFIFWGGPVRGSWGNFSSGSGSFGGFGGGSFGGGGAGGSW